MQNHIMRAGNHNECNELVTDTEEQRRVPIEEVVTHSERIVNTRRLNVSAYFYCVDSLAAASLATFRP